MLGTQLLENDVTFLRQIHGYVCPGLIRCVFRQLAIPTIEFLRTFYLRGVEALIIMAICQYGVTLAKRSPVARRERVSVASSLPGETDLFDHVINILGLGNLCGKPVTLTSS